MDPHPPRRRHAFELALGVAVTLPAGWLLFGCGRAGPESDSPSRAAPATEAVREEPATADEHRSVPPLRVRVVDGSGKPVGGVAVDLLFFLGDAPDLERPCSSGETRATDGVVELAREVERTWVEEEGLVVVNRRVRVRALFAELPRADLGAELPADIVTIRLGDFGALEAQIPADSPSAVLEVATPALASETLMPLRIPFVDGRARLDVVGVGCQLGVRAVAVGRAASKIVSLAGPPRAGESVFVALEVGASLPEVTFVAVDEQGAPIANAPFYAIFPGVVLPDPGEARSDASGRLRFWIPEGWRPEVARTLVVRRMPATSAAPMPLTLWSVQKLEPLVDPPEARVTLPETLDARAPTDLGRVVVPKPASQNGR